MARDAAAQRHERRTRARFARRQWARRWLRWRPLLGAVVSLTLVLVGGWLLFFSDTLSVHDVEVSGNDLASDARVLRALGDVEGEQLVLVDIDDATRRVGSLREVRSVDVTRQWPDVVRVVVTERVPVAVVSIGGTLHGLDAEGVVFRDYAKAPAGLPMVRPSTGAPGAALTESAAVASALPEDLGVRVDHIEVATIDRITLVLRDGRRVVWGSAEESGLKAEVTDALLAEQKARVYDVTVPGRPVVAQGSS